MDGSQGNDHEWNKPISEGYIYKTFVEWQNYRDREEMSGSQGLGMQKGNDKAVAIKG